MAFSFGFTPIPPPPPLSLGPVETVTVIGLSTSIPVIVHSSRSTSAALGATSPIITSPTHSVLTATVPILTSNTRMCERRTSNLPGLFTLTTPSRPTTSLSLPTVSVSTGTGDTSSRNLVLATVVPIAALIGVAACYAKARRRWGQKSTITQGPSSGKGDGCRNNDTGDLEGGEHEGMAQVSPPGMVPLGGRHAGMQRDEGNGRKKGRVEGNREVGTEVAVIDSGEFQKDSQPKPGVIVSWPTWAEDVQVPGRDSHPATGAAVPEPGATLAGAAADQGLIALRERVERLEGTLMVRGRLAQAEGQEYGQGGILGEASRGRGAGIHNVGGISGIAYDLAADDTESEMDTEEGPPPTYTSHLGFI